MKVIPNPADYGMVGVSSKAFYATVGMLDVEMSLSGEKWDDILGYKGTWKTRHGTIVGLSIGAEPFSEPTYMVTSSFFDANRSAIEAATLSAARSAS